MWLEKFNAMRKQSGMSLDELSEKSGVPKGTLSKITSGITKSPSLETIKSLVYTMGGSLSDLDEISHVKKSSSLSDEALKVARDYNGLDTHGKTMTRLVISEEQKRMDEEVKAAETSSSVISFSPKKKTAHKGIVTLEVYEEPSAAGTGNIVSDMPASHTEQYPEEYVPSQTDFGVIISGQSMEPKYPDQAVVFVKSTQVVEPGEIGIFLLDGQTYIKQLQVEPESGDVSLHSLNPDYRDINVSPYADFRSLGKVLGGYNPTKKEIIWK